MLEVLLIAVLSAEPGTPTRAELRHELDGVAERIAALKSKAREGEDVHDALQPLLVRAQELAEALDRTTPEPHAPAHAVDAAARAGSPADAGRHGGDGTARATEEDLRTHADLLYEEADALAGDLVELEARISAALDAGARRPEPEGPPGHASPAALRAQAPGPARCAAAAAPPDPPPPAVVPLLEERARLKARVRALLAEAAELDQAADRLER
jgi:hypothetical protein